MFWGGRSQIYKIKEIASALLRSHDEAIEVHGERVTGGLTKICRKHHMRFDSIKEWNRMGITIKACNQL